MFYIDEAEELECPTMEVLAHEHRSKILTLSRIIRLDHQEKRFTSERMQEMQKSYNSGEQELADIIKESNLYSSKNLAEWDFLGNNGEFGGFLVSRLFNEFLEKQPSNGEFTIDDIRELFNAIIPGNKLVDSLLPSLTLDKTKIFASKEFQDLAVELLSVKVKPLNAEASMTERLNDAKSQFAVVKKVYDIFQECVQSYRKFSQDQLTKLTELKIVVRSLLKQLREMNYEKFSDRLMALKENFEGFEESKENIEALQNAISELEVCVSEAAKVASNKNFATMIENIKERVKTQLDDRKELLESIKKALEKGEVQADASLSNLQNDLSEEILKIKLGITGELDTFDWEAFLNTGAKIIRIQSSLNMLGNSLTGCHGRFKRLLSNSEYAKQLKQEQELKAKEFRERERMFEEKQSKVKALEETLARKQETMNILIEKMNEMHKNDYKLREKQLDVELRRLQYERDIACSRNSGGDCCIL